MHLPASSLGAEKAQSWQRKTGQKTIEICTVTGGERLLYTRQERINLTAFSRDAATTSRKKFQGCTT